MFKIRVKPRFRGGNTISPVFTLTLGFQLRYKNINILKEKKCEIDDLRMFNA